MSGSNERPEPNAWRIHLASVAILGNSSMSSVPKTGLTSEQYLARERRATFKSEFFRGETFALAGASAKHNLIVLNYRT